MTFTINIKSIFIESNVSTFLYDPGGAIEDPVCLTLSWVSYKESILSLTLKLPPDEFWYWELNKDTQMVLKSL